MKLTLVLALLPALVQGYNVEEKQKEQKTFQLASGSRKVIVDTVFGSVEVLGYSGTAVEIVADEDWRADSNEKLAEAHQKIKLDMTQDGNTVKIYEDGPFRCHQAHCFGNDQERGYQTVFHLHLKVPRDTAVEARAVNGGLVRLENLDGEFLAHNVNGKIELTRMGSSGEASTVNGSIVASFTRNPQHDERFHTVNGSIELTFQPNLAADVSAKTLNGGVYTDFEPSSTVQSPVSAQQRGTRQGMNFVFSRHRATHVLFGSGGPKLELETVNGTISILQASKGGA